jgi:hypothetical protein
VTDAERTEELAKCGKESLSYCQSVCEDKTRESGIPKHDGINDNCPFGNPSLEDSYDKEVIELVEKYGWVIAETRDDPDYRAWFAYRNFQEEEFEDLWPADWITSCENVDDIYEWLISDKEGIAWRKKIDARREQKEKK